MKHEISSYKSFLILRKAPVIKKRSISNSYFIIPFVEFSKSVQEICVMCVYAFACICARVKFKFDLFSGTCIAKCIGALCILISRATYLRYVIFYHKLIPGGQNYNY